MVDLNDVSWCEGCGRKFRGSTARCIPCLMKPPKTQVDVVGARLKDEVDENMRALLSLCHPDKHDDSKMSQRVTLWLLEVRARHSKRKS